MAELKLFTGNANPILAELIAARLGIPLAKATVGKYNDGETKVEILESIRGRDVVIIQSLSAPINDHLMEVLLLADAAKRASANSITAVIPYLGYSRQDRGKIHERVPIAAKLVADMLATSGINKLLTADLHGDHIKGFFTMPIDVLSGSNLLLNGSQAEYYKNWVIVAPDIGAILRAREFAKKLNNAKLAIIDKRRNQDETRVMNVIGEIRNHNCLLLDDMVDSAGTLCCAAKALADHGAKQIHSFCTHPILSGKSIDKIESSYINKLIVSNSIILPDNNSKKITQLSIAPLLADAIKKIC